MVLVSLIVPVSALVAEINRYRSAYPDQEMRPPKMALGTDHCCIQQRLMRMVLTHTAFPLSGWRQCGLSKPRPNPRGKVRRLVRVPGQPVDVATTPELGK